jgi:hypothetical protein
MVAMALIDQLLSGGHKVLLVECDTSNPDVGKTYRKDIEEMELINLALRFAPGSLLPLSPFRTIARRQLEVRATSNRMPSGRPSRTSRRRDVSYGAHRRSQRVGPPSERRSRPGGRCGWTRAEREGAGGGSSVGWSNATRRLKNYRRRPECGGANAVGGACRVRRPAAVAWDGRGRCVSRGRSQAWRTRAGRPARDGRPADISPTLGDPMEDAGRSSNGRVPRIVAERPRAAAGAELANPTVMVGVDRDRVGRAPSGIESGDGIDIAGNPGRNRGARVDDRSMRG